MLGDTCLSPAAEWSLVSSGLTLEGDITFLLASVTSSDTIFFLIDTGVWPALLVPFPLTPNNIFCINIRFRLYTPEFSASTMLILSLGLKVTPLLFAAGGTDLLVPPLTLQLLRIEQRSLLFSLADLEEGLPLGVLFTPAFGS
jgi:hypothetical protein